MANRGACGGGGGERPGGRRPGDGGPGRRGAPRHQPRAGAGRSTRGRPACGRHGLREHRCARGLGRRRRRHRARGRCAAPRRDSLDGRYGGPAAAEYGRVRTGQSGDEACLHLLRARIGLRAGHGHQSRTRVFGLVLAHEIGHMLLPRYSHTALGLMKAGWVGAISAIPEFLPEQAATIRTLLAARPWGRHTMTAQQPP